MSVRPFTVVFYNRNFAGILQPPVTVSVERYSWHMIGGPKTAYLTAPVTADKWELTKLLRCPVEIRGGDGRLNFYGYVNKVSIPIGSLMIGFGLDEMFNSIIIDYAGGTSAAATDTVSIGEYGTKEDRLSDSNATQTEGQAERDLYLAQHKKANPVTEVSNGRGQVRIECYGWLQTLDWRYYTETSTTSLENTAQITDAVTDCGQFFRGTKIENLANLTSNPARDGKSTALACVNKILNAGTSNGRPLLARVDADRWLHVYERAVEPPLGAADYLLRDDGNLLTSLGVFEPPEHCICAAWVQVQGVPDQLAGISAMRPFFIESADYDALRDVCTYRPGGAFDQVRLAKYIKGVTGGHHGGGSSQPIDLTPSGSVYQPYATSYAGQDMVAVNTARGITVGATWNSQDVGFTVQSSGVYLFGGSMSVDGPTSDVTASASGGAPSLSTIPEIDISPTDLSTAWPRITIATMKYMTGGQVAMVSFGMGGGDFIEGYAWIVKVSE